MGARGPICQLLARSGVSRNGRPEALQAGNVDVVAVEGTHECLDDGIGRRAADRGSARG